MTGWRGPGLRRMVLGLWLLVVLGPAIVGCATPRGGGAAPTPSTVQLAAVVLDGDRLARAGEAVPVWVHRQGSQVPVRPGMALQEGDRIETGADAEAVIRYPSGTELLLRPHSGGRIGSFTEFVGEVFAKIKGLFAVETTFVKAGAKGTAFLVRGSPGGTATVIVFEGAVEMASTRGAWPALELGPGTMARAHPRAPIATVAPPEELARTREWVERLERMVPAGTGGGSAAAVVGIAVLVAALLAAGSSTDADRPSADPKRPPTHAPRLAAPTGLTPGSENPRTAPSLDCRAPLRLSWRAVAGADYYVPDVDWLRPGSRRWQSLPAGDTSATWTRLRANLEGEIRWSVRAHDERGAGPSSPVLTLRCSGPIVR